MISLVQIYQHFGLQIILEKISSLFSLKDWNICHTNVIYKGKYEACQECNIGETGRKQEHKDKIISTTEPALHLYANPDHSFTWKILCVCINLKTRHTLEALLIGRHQPSLNKQVSAFRLTLYPKKLLEYLVLLNHHLTPSTVDSLTSFTCESRPEGDRFILPTLHDTFTLYLYTFWTNCLVFDTQDKLNLQ